MSRVDAKNLVFITPGPLETETGGYVYDRHLVGGLRDLGWRVDHVAVGESFPEPTASDMDYAREVLTALRSDQPVIIDGLALGAIDTNIVTEMRAPLWALVHHPLAYEGGLEARRREKLYAIEKANLSMARGVIVPSNHTRQLVVSEYGIAPSRVHVVTPGITRPSAVANPSSPPVIVSVGIIAPRKGHDVLLRALLQIESLPWEAVIVGGVRDENYLSELVALREQLGLDSRVEFAGEVSHDEREVLYRRASIFALATRFEGYGMVFDEAMAHGLPIVSCDTGAVGDTVAPGAGVLVPVDDPEAFAVALREVLTNSSAREVMSQAGLEAAKHFRGWDAAAASVAHILLSASRDNGGNE